MEEELDKLKKAIINKSDIEINRYFEIIYSKYYKIVHFAVSKYVDDLEDIREIVNETFLSFYGNVFEISNSKSYLLKTAINKAIDHLRKVKEIPIEKIEEMTYVKDSYFSEYLDLINVLKSLLTNKEIEIVLLHVIENLKFKDIGKRMNKKESTIRSIYNRAIRKTRRKNEGNRKNHQ